MVQMYKIASLVSFIIRAYICYLTIETVPIFQNEYIGWVFGQIVSLYTILWFISYLVVNRVFGYRRGEAPVLGVLLYAIVYIPLSLLLWLLLWALTLLNLLPL